MSDHKKAQSQADSFFDIPAVWAVEPPPSSTIGGARPETLAQWCAGAKQLGEPVGLELHSGESWSVAIRVAATTWLSGQTTGQNPRGVFVALRALSAAVGPHGREVPSAEPVDVALFEALAHSLRVNSRVVLGMGSRRLMGSVSYRGEDYLALHTAEKLSGHSHLRVVPLGVIDYVSFLEPGDSF